MKRFLSALLCAALLVSIAALSGCKSKKNSLSGLEIAKMLLANQHLNPLDLDLGLEAALTGETKAKSADALAVVNAYKPAVSLLSTSQSGSTVQWRDFTDESNTYAFFQSYFVNIENTANSFADEIAAIKESCGNTNYWMKRPGTSEKFLLTVRANEDILVMQSEDALQICRRYANENADDVYDMYSKNLDGSYEERCLYIFRKQLIDRMHIYGEKLAVITSALILLAYVLSGNQYSPFAIVMVCAGLAGLAIGIFGGLYTIVSNRAVDNKPDTEEQK